jgi:multiple sugar transport system permease protein
MPTIKASPSSELGAGGRAVTAAPAHARILVSRRLAPYVFLAPFLLLFAGFLVAPLLYAFQMSLFRETLVGGARFVGLDNYVRAIHDKSFWDGVGLLLQFGLMQIPVMLGLALVFALILDSGIVFARGFFRVAFFIPYAVPAVIATLLWGYLYGPAFGPFSQLSEAMGFGKIDFLSGGGLLPSLANIAVWEYMGYNMIIYYAALQAVPRDLEEASAIDGATALQHSLRIKLPLIAPTIIVTVIFSIIGTLQLFTEPYLMRNLAPSQINSHYTPNYYAYTLAFTSQQFNYSAAISFVLGAVVAVASYGFMLLANRRGRR